MYYNFCVFATIVQNTRSPGALDLYPDKIHNKLILPEKVPRGTYINILKVPENPPGAFQEIRDGVQDGRRRIVISRKLCKAVNFSSIFFCNIPFRLVLWSVSPSSLLPDNIDGTFNACLIQDGVQDGRQCIAIRIKWPSWRPS